MKQISIRKVKSADRTIDLLECLADSPGPMSASALSEALDIPKSSLFHLIGTLSDRRYVTLAEGNGYRLGPKVSELARKADTGLHLGRLMTPVIEELSLALNETCSFNVQREDDVEVIATHTGQQALTYTMKLGDLAPLYAVSAGKIILAGKSKEWLDAYLKRVKFEQFTPNTIQSHERLLREIERARAEGFGFVDQEFTPGIIGIGACVTHNGSALGAINVTIPAPRFETRVGSVVRQHLRKAVVRAEAIFARSSLS